MTRKSPKSFDDGAFLRWKSLLNAYDNEPTITNYVRLKRATGMSAVVQKFIDFDPHAIAEALQQFGIEPLLVSGALDGDGSDIEELSVRLMERLIERDGLEKGGRTQVQSRGMAISDSLIDFLIVVMLQAVLEDEHSALSVLIQERLCGRKPDFYNEHLRLINQRKAVALAALKFPAGKISVRKVAKLMKVEPSTVSRWFPAGDLQEQVEQFRKSVDAFGLREERAKPQKKMR
jgi:hypothetical protein